MNLTAKFSLFIVFLVFIILSTTTVVFVIVRAKQIQDELTEQDKITSVVLARELSDGFADYYFYQYDTYRNFVKEKMKEYPDVLHFTMYSTNGDILFDSTRLSDAPGTPPAQIMSTNDPETLSIVNSQKPSISINTYEDKRTIQIFRPYVDKYGVYRNSFEIHFSTDEVIHTIRETVIYSLIFIGIFTVVSVALTFLLVSQIVKPVKILTEAARKFSEGNLNYSVDIHTSDEIGALATAFKHMAEDLQVSHSKLTDQNEKLELEVENRTSELRNQLMEMEKLQKLTVDRELKMVEMKKELEKLKHPEV